MSIEEVEDIVREVEGHISNVEGEWLYHLARSSNMRGVIVEIGSWRGKSTIWLAKGAEAGNKNKVYAVDPHRGTLDWYGKDESEPIFRRNIRKAGVDDIVAALVMKSEEATRTWQQPISLLWIDGSHDYEDVKKDFVLWGDHLVQDGVVAFHDCLDAGVRKVIKEYVLKSPGFSEIGCVERILFATKRQEASYDDRITKWRLLIVIYAATLVDFLTKHKLVRPIRNLMHRFGLALLRIFAR